MTEIFDLSTEVTEKAKQAAEAVGLELNELKIIKLGAKSIQVLFTLNDYQGVNE